MKRIVFLLLTVLQTTLLTAQDWKQISVSDGHGLGITNCGTLFTWGFDANMQVDSVPKQIGLENNWKMIAAGRNFSAALKTDGSLWTWGNNYYGQLGDGSNTNKLIPIQVDSNVYKFISASFSTLYAIKTDGTLWATGGNSSGQLGDGTSVDKNTLVQIGLDNDWKMISAGAGHVIGLKNNGKLYSWGNNVFGQLGDNTTIARNVPTQIGVDTDWVKVNTFYNHNLAIKSNGSLYAWGNNYNGQLGDNSTTDKLKPTQIGIATDWTEIAAGDGHSLALKSDSTLWTWGNNYYGSLCDSSNINKPTPNIFNNKKWLALDCGKASFYAIAADDKLYACGMNGGWLGDGGISDKNYFVQIGLVGCNPLSVFTKNVESNNLSIYPNPNSGKFYIESNSPLQIKIYNTFGENIYNIAILNTKHEIDISNQPTGVYQVIASINDRTISRLIVVQK